MWFFCSGNDLINTPKSLSMQHRKTQSGSHIERKYVVGDSLRIFRVGRQGRVGYCCRMLWECAPASRNWHMRLFARFGFWKYLKSLRVWRHCIVILGTTFFGRQPFHRLWMCIMGIKDHTRNVNVTLHLLHYNLLLRRSLWLHIPYTSWESLLLSAHLIGQHSTVTF